MILLGDLKEWLGIDAGTTTFDDLLTALEARAVAFVEAQTGRYFGAEGNVTEIKSGSGTRELYLREPANSPAPTSLSYTTYVGASALTITAANTDGFEVRTEGSETRFVRKGGYYWHREYEYTIAYNRGYSAGNEPGDVRQLVIDLVALKYRMREHGDGTIVSETIDNYSYRLGDFSDGDLDTVPMGRSTIEHWRRRKV